MVTLMVNSMNICTGPSWDKSWQNFEKKSVQFLSQNISMIFPVCTCRVGINPWSALVHVYVTYSSEKMFIFMVVYH